jgi:hypothetical protein
METISLARDEWEAVDRELAARYTGTAPPGLRERIADMLLGVPRGWEHEACSLEVDAAGADVVRAIVRRGRGQATDPGLERSQQQSLGEADRIVRESQQHPPGTEPDRGA